METISRNVPLLQTQLGMYFESVRMGGSAYNRHFLYTLDKSLDMERLARAIEKTVQAHPYMNVRISQDDSGEITQSIPETQSQYHQTVERITESQWRERLKTLISEPLTLNGGRLFRFDLVETECGKYMLRTTHHIAFDEMSHNVMMSDIAAAYDGKELTQETYNALDVAEEESKLRDGKEYQCAKEWYEARFSGLDVVSSPLSDNSGNDAGECFIYPFDLSEADMKKFCREKSVSTSSLISAAFALLTGFYTNQQESLFTTIYHGRNKNAAHIIGMFVKTLPFYAKWENDTVIADFLKGLSEQIQGARDNDIFSFADVNGICPMNDAPMFAWHGAMRTHVEVCGMPAVEELLDKNTNDSPLSVDLMSVPSGLSLRVEYDSGKYTREFVETLAKTYENILRQLMTKEYIREISPCPQGTKAGDFNDTDYPVELCAVHTLFEAQVKNHPDTIAFIADNERLTYGELNGRANRLAHSLIERGIQPESIVGLLLPRTIAVPVCEYGVWKAGGAFLPMSAEYPDERIDICLRDAGCRFCITTEAVKNQRKNLFTTDKPYTVLTVEELCRNDSAENPGLTVNPLSLAYVIYTSGSTGRPKGVMLEHGNLCNFVSANEKNMETREFIRGGKTALALAAISFNVSMMEIHISLTHGMTCVMATEEEIHNPLLLAGLIENEAVDVVCFTPSYLASLLQFPEIEDALRRVKMYDVGAEAFPSSLYGKIRAASPDAVIVNGYGPTEATISCVARILSGGEKITIGRPSANVKVWVMDKSGHELPAGAVGELVIGGLGVGRGYMNLPEKTSEAFFTHEGVRAYRTGDIVRLLHDSDGFNVDYIGRGDRQVKIRGLRIELDEVESVIREFPGVTDVAVVAFDGDGDSGKFMAAYVVSSGKIDIPALNDFIRDRKPPYMIPSVTIQIDAIPLTPSQKVDRKALPKPDMSAVTSSTEIIQPRTDAEKRVCDVISGITGAKNFGMNMTLEEIGINSLAMMRLAITLSREFSHPLNFADLQQNNTPEKLASFLEGVNDDEDSPVLDDYPLTKTQEGIFFETQSHPGTTIYNIATLLELAGTPNVQRIKDAVISAVKAHPYLLTRFFLNDKGEIRQKRTEDFAFDVEESRFRNLDELKKNLLRPYDLLNDRLIRANIARTDDGKIYVYLDMNHAVFDGMSQQIFLRDIERAYNGETLEPEKFSGFEAALLEERLRNSPQYQKAKDYYTELFKDCDSDCLPLSDMQENAQGSLSMILSGHADAESIRKFCDDNGISENDFYIAAFGYVIAGFNGRGDSVFTTINNGRSDSRFMDSVSMFVRTYPVICKITNGTVLDYIRETKRQLTDSLLYGAYSLAEMSHDLGINSDILFAFQGAVSGKTESFCGCPCSEVNMSLDEAKAGIEMLVFPENGGLSYHFTCRKNLYTEDFIRNFAGVYDNILTEFTRKKNLNDAEFLDAEAESLLDKANDNATDYDKSDIVTQFRKAAEIFPDNIAVVYNEKRYTYKEADEITERIAAYLKGRGIGAEDVVSILIPRCEYIALASLGVLKSCAAYQPLDPTYPPERLEFMIKDASAKLLIADRNLINDCVPNYHGDILYTDEIPSLPHAQKLTETPKPSNLFIMLYTSGSTGVPKGVMLEHGNIACFIAWDKRTNNITEKSRILEYASYGFDAHMIAIYPALTAGAAVHIVGEEMRLDFEALQKYIDDEGITNAFITTQVGRQFAEYYTGHSLKYLYVGGEKLAPIFPDNKSFTFCNGYGPTECTIFTTTFPVKKLYRRVPIGAALDNMKLYIVDKNGRRLPPYMPGELWVSGHQVGRGYLNRPEKNAESFTANPFTNEEGYTRIYRTGDIVRNVYEGGKLIIDFVGRNDAQVKVRGFRIELPEVENVIREFPGVKDVTVQAFDSDGGEKYLAAYVVSDGKIDVKALNEFIGQNKPPYMIPAVTMQIDAIPLNQNQKVNRKALPKPEITTTRTESESVSAPLNVLEKDIKAIIAEIIGMENFGITDTLGNFGLTSISSIRLATQIYKKYGVQLQVRRLVTEGSIQSIENEILRKVFAPESSGKKSEPEKSHEPSKKSCPLTFEQQGVYADCMIDPSSTVYNTPFSVKIPDGVTAEQIRDAVRGVVEAHSYILCRFTANDKNEIIQEPIPNFTLDIPIKEMSAQDYESYCKEGFVRPFNLAEGPLVRFEIVKADGLYLLMDMHHLVTDGASVDIFLHQLCEKLDGNEIPPEEYSYYDYAADERMTDGADEFFAGRMALSDEATQIIPDVYGENLNHSEESVSVKTDIKAVKDFALKHNATPAEIYLAAGYITFARFVCNDTVSIMTISNGRGNMKIAGTLGMFVNSLPLVETVDSSETVADFIKRSAKNFSDTLLHENYPFARAAKKFDFHPSISYAYQIGVFSEYRTKYGALTAEELSSDKAKIPVSVFITGTEDEAEIKINYDTAMYSREIMQSLAECYENAVQGLLTQEKISDISITDSRQWEILDSYNPEWDLNYDMNDTPVSAFRKNAAKNPDKVAAVFMDKQYTYRELDELTDRLAAKIYSRMKAITGRENLAEEVISIIIPRNENVFILPLAVVKAGCAYEPLDPSYPQERLNFMVKDSGAKLLIADDSLRSLVNEYEGDVLTVSELYAMNDSNDTPPTPSPENLFVMLYTSGSTGTPKGCQIEHRNVVALAHGIGLAGFYREDDRIADYASFGFDVNMADVFCTLINGGTVYIISEDIRMNLDALAKYFDDAGITALLLTTQVGVQFMQNYPHCKTLRLLIIAGEKLPAVDPSGLSYTIANGYGPTENCYGVSIFPIHEWEQNIPIGKPFRTIHGYILDKTGHRLPAGAAGEYCLSGPQVSRGYLNRPDKTAEAYESCPFTEFRMYHTGDIVRYRQDGNVEFVGRKDGQVKIRGFRIETKEIEAVIRGFEGVKDATVQAYDYESGGKYLAAFVVSDNAIDTAKLADYIKSQKPAYMVPAVIMQIEKVPLTVNQKVDRKALPKPELQRREYVAPSGKTEEDFCGIFGEILGIERVGADDDFFELGGSSVIAMKVVIAAGKKGYSIVYNDVFKYTTPRLLAEFVTGSDSQPEKISANVTPSAGKISEVDEDGYDYSAINSLLAKNTMDAFRNGEPQRLGDVLLAGATGYLGIHVLRELLTSTESKIYCLIRPKDNSSGEKRLKNLLEYYFSNDYAEYFSSRITVIEGDATNPDSLKDFTPDSNITVINCAASVKHFAKGNEIERANVDSVKNLAAWCEEHNSRLVHISTGSIIGGRKNGLPPENYRFDEHVLFAGQTVKHNQYIHSKFMAERFIYEEILTHGLNAKVLRVGDLAPRLSDGKFQVNFRTNNIMNTLRAYKILGVASFGALASEMEFSPIDCLAKAVIALARTPKECVCFMPINPHRALMQDIFAEIGGIRAVEDDEMKQALDAALSDSTKNSAVAPLIAYSDNSGVKELGLDDIDTGFTSQVLYRLGFSWPETGAEYIRQFIRKLNELSFFDE